MLKDARVLVVGDVMLDRYWFGDVHRISPEAPVPIVRVEKQEERLGGAANVARNIASLGGQARLLGVIGTDTAGVAVNTLLDTAGVDNCLVHDPAMSTIVKLRVIGHQQQLLRIDFEAPPSDEVLHDQFSRFTSLLTQPTQQTIIVLSDYGKGCLVNVAAMIALAKQAGVRVLVDPKGDDFSRYRGASLLTPNQSELKRIVGPWKNEDDLSHRAQQLRQELALDALVLTRSEQGMSVYTDQAIQHFPAQSREVFDVSGAGDTVIATLAATLAVGLPLDKAVALANRAGGIVVGKLGTATVNYQELIA